MKKKLLILCLTALGLSDIIDARGGGGHGGGGRGGGGHRSGGGGGHRSGGHGSGRSASRGGHSRSSSHNHGSGRGYGRGGYGRGGYGYGGWGAWGGWGWGLGLGLGVGMMASSNRWYTAPGQYGDTYIDNSNYNNYFYDNEALYDAQSGEKVTDYSDNDRKSGLKKHIEKLKTERTNLRSEEQDKKDAIDKRIKELEEGLKS